MTSDALNAAYVSNLIGVGEVHRRFLGQRRDLSPQTLSQIQKTFLLQLDQVVRGESGVFEKRRNELSTILSAQNALFRIRHDAGLISASASNFAISAEQFLAAERDSSSSAIQLTKLFIVIIALASLFLALISARYVSRYVTFNMARISAAMVQLAQGDRSSSLPRKVTREDEIGDLFRSFRSFRANALRLDRSIQQLDQRNALFQKVFTNISDGIAITEASGKITAQNPALVKILGLPDEQIQSSSFVKLLESGRFGAAVKDVGLSDDHRGFCDLVSKDAQYVELRASRLPDDGRVWLCSDVTERRRLVERIQQIDRIETLGKVAGDTAHDFGNILSTISTHAHLLEPIVDEKSQPTLCAINNAVEYGSSLTQRLLAFAKKQHLTPEIIELNALVGGMVDLVEISLKPDVELQVNYANSQVLVLVDPGQLESSILNLVLNANQAIEGSGVISITLGINADEDAFVTIQDTGAGMSDKIMKRVVEPFFTTRSGDGGTGLGLSIAYGFVRQTGGDLKICSELGKGTKIDITLPMEQISAEAKLKCAEKSVLLVEDEEKARIHARRALEGLGFKVTEISDAPAALEQFTNTTFDLLVTDLNLGSSVDGWDLVEQFIVLNPTKNAIVVSGRLPEVTPLSEKMNSNVICFAKPLNIRELSATVRDIFEHEKV